MPDSTGGETNWWGVALTAAAQGLANYYQGRDQRRDAEEQNRRNQQQWQQGYWSVRSPYMEAQMMPQLQALLGRTGELMQERLGVSLGPGMSNFGQMYLGMGGGGFPGGPGGPGGPQGPAGGGSTHSAGAGGGGTGRDPNGDRPGPSNLGGQSAGMMPGGGAPGSYVPSFSDYQRDRNAPVSQHAPPPGMSEDDFTKDPRWLARWSQYGNRAGQVAGPLVGAIAGGPVGTGVGLAARYGDDLLRMLGFGTNPATDDPVDRQGTQLTTIHDGGIAPWSADEEEERRRRAYNTSSVFGGGGNPFYSSVFGGDF
jgi:hypothetical protein